MDYKNELKENNADLEIIIELLNSLPDLDIPSSGGKGGKVFSSSAYGIVPEYEHGYATAILSNIFETSAIGAVVE